MAERATKPPILGGLTLPFRPKARRPGPLTALELDGRVLRVAQGAVRGNRAVVTRVEVADLPLAAEADRANPLLLGQAIATCLEALRVKPGQVVIGVPRHSVILRTLTLPLIEDVRELASVVHMQIGKDLPFRQEDAVIDFKVRPGSAASGNSPPAKESGGPAKDQSSAAPKVEVMVAALKTETVAFYTQLAAAAKLKLAGLGWLSQANARGLEACQLGAGKEAVALVSVRPEEIGIDIVADGSLRFSRGAGLAPQAPAAVAVDGDGEPKPGTAAAEPAEPATQRSIAEAATIEVVRSLHSYGGTGDNAAVGQVVVVGATGQEESVQELLRTRLSLPVRGLDVGEALDLPTPARAHGPGAFSVIGLALSANDPEGLPFDFLNPKRPAVHRNMRRIWTLAGSAAGMAVVIGLLGFRSHLVKQRDKVREAIQAEVKKAESNMTLYRRMQQQAATLQTWNKQGRNWLEQYPYLSSVLPGSEDLYITSLSVSGQGNIHLAVQARSGEILASLDRQLRAAGYEVKPLAITPGNDKHGYNFRSTVELILPPKMTVDLSKTQPPARPADDASLEGKSKVPKKGGRS